MKILVIAPHPDDEVLGCAGTIKKYSKQGNEIFLCIVTKAYTPDWSEEFITNRKKEIELSVKTLGISKLFLLDFPTVKLDIISQKELNDSISKVVQEVRPEIVFIPFSGDINKDHKLVAESALVAVRPRPDSPVKKVFCYEVLSETGWSNPAQDAGNIFTPNYYENISDFLDDKIKAIQCYKSELKEYPHPRSLEGIKILAQKRGMEVGKRYAEAFMLVREIK